MLNLNNVQLVLFDFDDTLCIHHEHSYSESSYLEYYKNILLKGSETYSTCDKNIHMQKFIELCKEHDMLMGLISAASGCKHAEAKAKWVSEQYGVELDNFSVGRIENKIKMMIAISEVYEIPRSKILLVDDYFKNLEDAANAGFSACSPMEIVNYVHDYQQSNL